MYKYLASDLGAKIQISTLKCRHVNIFKHPLALVLKKVDSARIKHRQTIAIRQLTLVPEFQAKTAYVKLGTASAALDFNCNYYGQTQPIPSLLLLKFLSQDDRGRGSRGQEEAGHAGGC